MPNVSNWEPDARSAKHLKAIRPELAVKVVLLLNRMATHGFPMTITDGNRTMAEQQALFAKGRFGNPGKRVTNADGVRARSNHQDGRAVDCYFTENGKVHFKEDGKWAAAWKLYGAEAKKLGLVWGGDWKQPIAPVDKPHVQLP